VSFINNLFCLELSMWARFAQFSVNDLFFSSTFLGFSATYLLDIFINLADFV